MWCTRWPRDARGSNTEDLASSRRSIWKKSLLPLLRLPVRGLRRSPLFSPDRVLNGTFSRHSPERLESMACLTIIRKTGQTWAAISWWTIPPFWDPSVSWTAYYTPSSRTSHHLGRSSKSCLQLHQTTVHSSHKPNTPNQFVQPSRLPSSISSVPSASSPPLSSATRAEKSARRMQLVRFRDGMLSLLRSSGAGSANITRVLGLIDPKEAWLLLGWGRRPSCRSWLTASLAGK